MRAAYFDCIAGISGDMALGALIDAGADLDELRRALEGLPIEPFELQAEEVDEQGLRAVRVDVHPKTPGVRSTTAGVIRTYASIRALLETAELPPRALELAQRMFRRLAEAEARVHRKEVDLVTFHELGAVDTIVDIVGTALALTQLGIERVLSSSIPTGFGMTRTEHGALPIPAPAVVELLQGAPLYSRGVPVELVTPTGAAILAATAEAFGEIPTMRIASVGYGAGTQRLDFPNVLRIIVGDLEHLMDEPEAGSTTEEIVLATNVDDLNPELYEYVLEQLLSAGAQDAWLTPIVMKKSRPAVTVHVLCAPERAEAAREILFRETGTLGVRATLVHKRALAREIHKVETRYGTVAVKIGTLDGRVVTVAPELDDCARVARETGIAARDVYEEAVRIARDELGHQ
ncbi:MAG: nickel pincer cofactor biosynthesis protein LarC [Actinomycetota bacterium]